MHTGRLSSTGPNFPGLSRRICGSSIHAKGTGLFSFFPCPFSFSSNQSKNPKDTKKNTHTKNHKKPGALARWGPLMRVGLHIDGLPQWPHHHRNTTCHCLWGFREPFRFMHFFGIISFFFTILSIRGQADSPLCSTLAYHSTSRVRPAPEAASCLPRYATSGGPPARVWTYTAPPHQPHADTAPRRFSRIRTYLQASSGHLIFAYFVFCLVLSCTLSHRLARSFYFRFWRWLQTMSRVQRGIGNFYFDCTFFGTNGVFWAQGVLSRDSTST